jgi:hypothetical protein
MALSLVSRVVVRLRRSIAKMLELPSSRSRLMITFCPSGEKRGAKVMPGKLPTTSRWPVSICSR